MSNEKNLVINLDAIMKTNCILLRLVRIIYYIRGITNRDFSSAHTLYFKKEHQDRYDKSIIMKDKHNKSRSIVMKTAITWAKTKIMLDILNLRIKSISIVVHDIKRDKDYTYRSDMTSKEIEEQAKEFNTQQPSSIINWTTLNDIDNPNTSNNK